jgi:hypothetical protein
MTTGGPAGPPVVVPVREGYPLEPKTMVAGA